MRKAVDVLMKFLSYILGILLSAAVIMVSIQVIWRYVLRTPIGWSDQLCRFLYVWIIMLGMPVLFHTKSATAFDFLSSKMGQKQQDILHVFVCLLTMAFAVCFCYFSWLFMMKKGVQPIPSFKGIKFFAVYASMPLSGVFLFIEMLMQLTETIKALVTGRGSAK